MPRTPGLQLAEEAVLLALDAVDPGERRLEGEGVPGVEGLTEPGAGDR